MITYLSHAIYITNNACKIPPGCLQLQCIQTLWLGPFLARPTRLDVDRCRASSSLVSLRSHSTVDFDWFCCCCSSVLECLTMLWFLWVSGLSSLYRWWTLTHALRHTFAVESLERAISSKIFYDKPKIPHRFGRECFPPLKGLLIFTLQKQKSKHFCRASSYLVCCVDGDESIRVECAHRKSADATAKSN